MKRIPKEDDVLRLALSLIAVAAAAPGFAAAAPVAPTPFTATYTVSYRGYNAGMLHCEFRPGEPGEFIYTTRPEPGLFAKLLVSGNAVERSVMVIDEGGVRPLFWHMDDGKRGSSGDGELEFLWDRQRIRGTVKGEAIDIPSEPEVQDRLSIQIAVVTALLRGREPGTIPLLDGAQIKHYSYTQTGTGRIETFAGSFDTVLYESTRPGSQRISRVWHAPELGYLPVRAEQWRKGKVETVMRLVKVERTDG